MGGSLEVEVMLSTFKLSMTEPSFNLPSTFPCLPPWHHQQLWSVNIQTAQHILADLYWDAFTTVKHDDADPLWVAFHINVITLDAIPLLVAIKKEGDSRTAPAECQLPEDWLHAGAELLGHLVVSLQGARDQAKGWCAMFLCYLLLPLRLWVS